MVGSARLSATSPRHLDGSSWGLVRGRRHTPGGESMSRIWLAGTSALALVIVCAGPARADNISTKKLFIKDPADPAKRQAQVQSRHVGRHFSAVDPGKFLGKGCMPATCDPEPTACSPPTTSTSTSTSTSSSTSSTCAPPTPPIARGSLTPTPGRFNYNLTLGLPGANAACNTNFAC